MAPLFISGANQRARHETIQIIGPGAAAVSAFLVLAAVVVVPLALSFYSSFTPFRLTKPESLYVFIGLRNYITVISSWDFWVAFGRTVCS